MLKKVAELIRKVRKLLTHDIWVMNFSRYKPWQARLLQILKIAMIVITDVPRDRCTLRAQSLTYSTLLAIVPLFAVVFSVLKGFGFQNSFGELFLSKLINSPSVVDKVIGFINNTSVQTLGAAGGAALLFTSVSLFSGIEGTFSDIWDIKTSRSFLRKMTDYLFIIMVFPIFVTAALTVSAGNYIGAGFVKTILEIPILKALVFGIYPYFSSWVVLFLLYMVLINTKVKWTAAAVGAIVAGTILHWAQGFYVTFASGINNYSIIFGSFAQPILAFVWLNLIWNIILIGSEVVYAVQNVHAYQYEGKRVGISAGLRDKAAFILVLHAVRQFRQGLPPFTQEELILRTKMPIKVVNDLLQELTERGVLVAAVNAETHQTGYSPAVDSDRLTVAFVMEKLRTSGVNEITMESEAEARLVDNVLKKYDRLIQQSFGKTRFAGL